MCKQEYQSYESTIIFTRKELVMLKATIYGFHTIFNIPSIQELAFKLPHARILGTNICGKMRYTAVKQRELFQDVLCPLDYSERVDASFDHQIQS